MKYVKLISGGRKMINDVYSKHHMLTSDGGPVSVYESGDERLPPVLLLHGAMYDEARMIWYHLAPYLSKSRRVFAIDFPRHGQSRPWTGFVGQNCLHQVVEEVIRHFALPPLPIIGLSMGGGIAIGYALEHPGQVTGAVLLGPGGLGDKVKGQFLSWTYIKIPGALLALTRYYGKLSHEKMRKTMAKLLHDGENSPGFEDLTAILSEEAKLKWKYKEKSLDDWQSEGMAPFKLKINFLPELHRLKCPALWIRGENDPLVGQSVMEEAARQAPNGKLIVVKNAGHLLPLEQPEEVNKAIEDFLTLNQI